MTPVHTKIGVWDYHHIRDMRLRTDGLRNCMGVELLPFHALGGSKYEKLGLPCKSSVEWVPSAEKMHYCREVLTTNGVKVFWNGEANC